MKGSGDRFKMCVDYLKGNRRIYNASDLAKITGKQKSYISELLSGKRSLSEQFVHKFTECFPEISSSWLICGEGEMIATPLGKKKIPLYDVETIGGLNEAIADTERQSSHVAEWIDAGDWFPGATAAIRHYGDSMVEYPSGSILALKRVEDPSLLINGQNYVIETSEYRITKQLQDDGGDYIMAYSSNRETYPDGRQIHSPIRIPKSEIRHIDLVLGCVIKEYSNGPVQIIKK